MVDINEVTEKASTFIAQHEGFRDKAYKCSADKWTIGYGTRHLPNGNEVGPNDWCTKSQAFRWLQIRVKSDIEFIIAKTEIEPNINQLVSFASLTYNIGKTGFAQSTVLREFNQSHFGKSADAFLMWNKIRDKAGKLVISEGLNNRRNAERELFLNSIML